MRRSIRGSLLGWYGALLTAVLAAFGGGLFWQAAAAVRAGVDAELDGRAQAIVAALEWDPREGWELDLRDDFLRGAGEGAHFGIWDAGGREVRRGGAGAPERPSGRTGVRERGEYREVERAGPEGTTVLVGRSIAPERARLATLRARVLGAGLGVLALALLVGGWIARRGLAPVEDLAAAAGRITERDLSTRLDVAGAPAELRGLASAFNAALERLAAAFARQARFTADASHELRTPVSIIRAQAESALRRDRTPEEYRRTLEACLRAAERMTGILEGLLRLARADAGDGALARAPVELAPLVEETTALLRADAAARGVGLRCTATPATVHGEAPLLSEVVTNLVSNAVRYNRPGGRVDVTLAPRNGEVELRVADTGVGIPADALPHVFERFFRVDPARSRERGGAGLGLAITRWIVEAHGGSLGVESREGEGSTFTVRLPASEGSRRHGVGPVPARA
ncbi:MAG: heavy metal sensor histidine kinase [Planctomycetes bacterium]|nr:heavy metal sensor histidine kinase [Planctomycetota bacterium]